MSTPYIAKALELGAGEWFVLVFDGVDDFAYREHHPNYDRHQISLVEVERPE